MSDQLFMLDTNIASFSMRSAFEPLRRRMSRFPISHCLISVITEAELRFGVAKSPDRARHLSIVENFLSHVHVLPWTSDAAKEYATLRHALNSTGRSLSSLDLLIAAHAKSAGAVLVSNDAALLRLSPLVKIVDWTAAGD